MRGWVIVVVAALAIANLARADEIGLEVRDGADSKSVEVVRVGEGSPAAAESLVRVRARS